MDYLFLELYF